jgi:hypothetical protein
MAIKRKSRFWMDDSVGALTEYTSQINKAALARMVDILETTALNDDDKTKMSGLRDFNIPINGMYNDTSQTTTTSIAHVLDAAQGTSITKTFQYQLGTGLAGYYTGEVLPAGLEISSDGQEKVVWSCTLEGTGAVTRTSVSLAG